MEIQGFILLWNGMAFGGIGQILTPTGAMYGFTRGQADPAVVALVDPFFHTDPNNPNPRIDVSFIPDDIHQMASHVHQ